MAEISRNLQSRFALGPNICQKVVIVSLCQVQRMTKVLTDGSFDQFEQIVLESFPLTSREFSFANLLRFLFFTLLSTFLLSLSFSPQPVQVGKTSLWESRELVDS